MVHSMAGKHYYIVKAADEFAVVYLHGSKLLCGTCRHKGHCEHVLLAQGVCSCSVLLSFALHSCDCSLLLKLSLLFQANHPMSCEVTTGFRQAVLRSVFAASWTWAQGTSRSVVFQNNICRRSLRTIITCAV